MSAPLPASGPLPTTVNAALAAACAGGVARLDAQLLLAAALDCPRAWLLGHGDALLAPAVARRFDAEGRRRAAGEPLAYLTGRREFHGLLFEVTPAVLVPRPETEHLVEWGLELLDAELGNRRAPRVADLGTGSGAIALALAAAWPAAGVVAVERSEAALAVARRNGGALGIPVDWRSGDWWRALAGDDGFDLVLSNPPYVAAGDPHLAALAHEPLSALVAGDDGLDALRTIVAGAPPRLAAGAWLLLEHGHEQGAAVRALLEARGFERVSTRADLAGLPRCTGGRWPGPTNERSGADGVQNGR
ncbi:MAG: peptide chain release factor N(5)-glutamine methyltransferase [Rubrivivax sp.]